MNLNVYKSFIYQPNDLYKKREWPTIIDLYRTVPISITKFISVSYTSKLIKNILIDINLKNFVIVFMYYCTGCKQIICRSFHRWFYTLGSVEFYWKNGSQNWPWLPNSELIFFIVLVYSVVWLTERMKGVKGLVSKRMSYQWIKNNLWCNRRQRVIR